MKRGAHRTTAALAGQAPTGYASLTGQVIQVELQLRESDQISQFDRD